jgi:osmotically-inducible protein OsmY
MKRPHKTVYKTDAEIRQAVEDAMLYDPRVLSFNPIIAVDNGVVTLTGTVDNLKAKRAAEQDAKNTTGVSWVRNHLKVRTQSQPPDGIIARNVKSALLRDPYVDRYQIGVTALNGVVYLNGTVDSWYEKAHAEDAASRIDGVTDVRNNLIVSYPALGYYHWPYSTFYFEPYSYGPAVDSSSTWARSYKSDAQVKEDIESEFFWSPFVDGDEVTVSVNNGVADLSGTVEGWGEAGSAIQNALEGGAVQVKISDLTVE